jgi:hypothetical protein
MPMFGHPRQAGRRFPVLWIVLGLYIGVILGATLAFSALAANATGRPVLPITLHALSLGAWIYLAPIPAIVLSVRRELQRRAPPRR